MKEKIIEKVKQTSLYKWYRKNIYATKLSDYNNDYLIEEKTDEYLKKLLIEDKPCMISRLGSNELKVLKLYIEKKQYSQNLKNLLKSSAGVFPNDDFILDKFAQLYLHDIENINLLGIWFNPFENKISSNYCSNAKITILRNLEPYFSDNPWSFYLKGKKVLVIHPFAESIEIQYKRKELLFKNPKVLPEFELIAYPAVQSLGGNDNFESWFDALEKMKNDIQEIDFDIAIIGAGAYGLPLASYIKEFGKKAIHLGGATQMLFGVYGQRWAIHPDFKDIINEYWIKPSENEKPKNADKVENACYW